MVDISRVNNTLGEMDYHLSNHKSISVGVSGGSDSNIIVHIIATHFREYLPRVHFVFVNTGLEYKATLSHLEYMEQRYAIEIDRMRGESIVTVCHRDGVPVLSKHFSQVVKKAKRGAKTARQIIDGEYLRKDGEKSAFNLPKKQSVMANYIIDSNIAVSDRCCDLSKKRPLDKYLRAIKADLKITGERQCEGGIRATRHKSCFESTGKIDKLMPLFFWNDETKQWYKEHEGIVYSECYEKWGMKRTGCVGCPYNSRVGDELKIIKEYEPNLYKACLNVFGESYMLMDKFDVHRKKILTKEE